MKIKAGQHLRKLLKRNVAVLLLVLFAGMPVFELAHSHGHEGFATGHFEQQLYKSAAKCKICDHFTHCQHMPFVAAVAVSVLYFEGQSCCIGSAAVEKLLALAGMSRGNKGPPVSI